MNATVQRIGALAAFFVAGIIAVCGHMEIKAAGSGDPRRPGVAAVQPGAAGSAVPRQLGSIRL